MTYFQSYYGAYEPLVMILNEAKTKISLELAEHGYSTDPFSIEKETNPLTREYLYDLIDKYERLDEAYDQVMASVQKWPKERLHSASLANMVNQSIQVVRQMIVG
jgi:hypothetical protein